MAERSKRCCRCGESKPELAFSPAKWRQAGGWCKACHKEYNHARYLAKREEVRKWGFAYRAANAERIKAQVRAKYWADVEASRARSRANARVQNAKPERKAAKREWARADRAANPEKWRAKNRAYQEANRVAEAEKARRYRERKRGGEIAPDALAAKWLEYDGCCWMCGGPAVEWDHVHPLAKGGAHAIENLRPACRSCNAQKSDRWPYPAAA